MKQPVDDAKKIEFYKALLALHADIDALKRAENNPFFNSKYVPLPDMLNALKPVLQKHGFILSQPIDVAPATPHSQSGYRNVVFSQVTHAATGISDMSKLALPDLTDMQKLGGAITYARRYTLSALLGLQEVDDDGNTAVGKKPTSSKPAVSSKDKF